MELKSNFLKDDYLAYLLLTLVLHFALHFAVCTQSIYFCSILIRLKIKINYFIKLLPTLIIKLIKKSTL